MEVTFSDDEMDDDPENVNMLDSDGYNVYEITDFQNNGLITSNQNNKSYATSLSIRIPNGQNTTVRTNKLIVSNPVEEGVTIPFNNFNEFVPSVSEQQRKISLRTGDSLIIHERTSTNDNLIPGNGISVIEQDIPGKTLWVKLLKNVRYYIKDRYNNPGNFNKDLYWLNRAVNAAKLFGLSKTLASGLIAVAADITTESTDDAVWYSNTMAISANESAINDFVHIEGSEIAEQLNGNIYSSDVIQFSLTDN